MDNEDYIPTKADIDEHRKSSQQPFYVGPDINSLKRNYSLPFERNVAQTRQTARTPVTPGASYGFNIALSPEEEARSRQEGKEFGLGAAQGALNTPEEYANIFNKSLYDKFAFAPDTTASKVGGLSSDLATFMLPGGIIKNALKWGAKIPKYGKAANNLLQAYEKSHPFIKNLINVGRTGLESATMAARKNPQLTVGERAKEAGKGAVFQQALNLLLSKNPIVNTLSRLTVGAGGGYLGGNMLGVPSYESVPAGIALMMGGPKVAQELGIGGKSVPEEYLQHTNPTAVQQRLEASKRLGTALRPSEASGNVYLGREEGKIPHTSAGAQEMSTQEAIRTKDQQAAINNLLHTIYPKTPEARSEIAQSYKDAYKWNMNNDFMTAIHDDPVIESAFKKIEKNPVYQKGLKGISENNVMYLDRVKTVMDDMRNSALRRGDKDEARIIKETLDDFKNNIDKSVPQYKVARDLAQKRIARANIQKGLRKGKNKKINAYNFYEKIVSNDEEYKKLYDSLSNVPEAQQIVKDMKTSWDEIIPNLNPRGAAKLSETNMSFAKDAIRSLIVYFKDLTGSTRDIERAKFIFSKDWDKEFGRIQNIKDRRMKRDEYIKLISKSMLGYKESQKE